MGGDKVGGSFVGHIGVEQHLYSPQRTKELLCSTTAIKAELIWLIQKPVTTHTNICIKSNLIKKSACGRRDVGPARR